MSSTPSPTHSDLGRAYRERLAREAVGAEELTAAATANRIMRISYRGGFLPAPVFLPADERDTLTKDVATVCRLLTELPERLYGGDSGALADAVGLSQTQARLARRAAAGPPSASLVRADLYHAADGFKLLEFNTSSPFGGADIAELNRAMLRHPALARFTAEHRLGYVDPLQRIAATLRAECAQPGMSGQPVVALADWPSQFGHYELWLRVFASLLEEAEFEVVPCHVGQLAERHGRLEADRRPVDVVLRTFLAEDIRTPADADLLEPLLHAVETGAVRLVSRLDSEVYGSKAALALLSDEHNRDTFDDAELACLDRLLPWTRQVQPIASLPDGSAGDLVSYACAERPNLILKPVLLHGGNGIVPGWTASAQEWQDRVTAALGGPYVLQRRVMPVTELFPGKTGAADLPMYLNWGIFLNPSATGSDRYGGGYIRASSDPDVGVISGGSIRASSDPDVGVIGNVVGATIGCLFHEL